MDSNQVDQLSDLELAALTKVTDFNNALNGLKSAPGFDVYMDEVKKMKEGVLNSFGLIQGKTIEEVGMKTLVLQAQLGFIESLFQLTNKGYEQPTSATPED